MRIIFIKPNNYALSTKFKLLNVVPGFEGKFLDRGPGFGAFLARVFPNFLLILSYDITKIFDDLLFEVEAAIQARDSLKVLREGGLEFLFASGCFGREFFDNCGGFFVSGSDLITKLWKGFHVALTAFDLLIENNSVEAFFAAHKFVGKGEVSAGCEPKKV